jgi:hypothetical protein
MEVVDVNRIAGDVVSIIIGFTDECSGLRAASGEPHGEASSMMVATVIILQ